MNKHLVKNITLLFFLSFLFLNCKKEVSKDNSAQKKNNFQKVDKIDSTQQIKKDIIPKIEYHSYIYKDDEIAKIPKQIISQIPKDYSILDVANGNLNDDNFDDYIITLKRLNEEIDEHANSPNRILMIFLANENKGYILTKKNDKNAVLGLNCGTNHDDPFLGVKMDKKKFIIEHGVASGRAHWKQFDEFQYDKKLNDWVLIKSEMTSYSEDFEEGLKIDKEYGLPIRNHILKTQKDFGIVTIENFENKE